jgi:hypothetical protein
VINRSDGWVLDGSYQGKLGDLVLHRADTIVWLDQPPSRLSCAASSRER